MRIFLSDNNCFAMFQPDLFDTEFASVSICATSSRLTGSALQTIQPSTTADIQLPKSYIRTVLSNEDKSVINQLLGSLHSIVVVSVNSIACKYSSLSVGSTTYSAIKRNTCIALASWNREWFGSMPCDSSSSIATSSCTRPVLVNHFVKITYMRNDPNEPTSCSTDILARVSWFMQHPAKDHFGQPAEVWCNNIFESFGVHSYIPVTSLVTQCVHCILKISGENVLVVVPLT